MTKKFELGISANYVSDWGLEEGIRELLQNAYDEETPDNKCVVTYIDNEINIHSPGATLDRASILLGMSNKHGVEPRGKFGEGYKLACLALVRAGCRVTIETGTGEVWRPRLMASKRFGTDVLVFDVEDDEPQDGVTFTIMDVYHELDEMFQRMSIRYNEFHDVIDTDMGQIILDEGMEGMIYVGDLYVCRMGGYAYGYNVKPSHMKINRDRRMVDSFDLSYHVTSRMWAQIALAENKVEEVLDMIMDDKTDVEWIKRHCPTALRGALCRRLLELYPDHIPVFDQSSLRSVSKRGYKPVLVTSSLFDLLEANGDIDESMYAEETAKDKLIAWADQYAGELEIEAAQELQIIIDMMED